MFAAERHRKAVGELLGRLTSQATAPADVWKLYADLHLSSKELSDHDKVDQSFNIEEYKLLWDLGMRLEIDTCVVTYDRNVGRGTAPCC